MAEFLGQIQPYPNTVADSLNNFAQQVSQRKQQALAQQLELLKSGLYKPTGQAQPQPGLMNGLKQGFLGPQAGGQNMNVMGVNYQFDPNQMTPDKIDLALKQKQLSDAQMTPEQKAQNTMKEIQAIQTMGIPQGGTASVDSSGGATMSYTPPSQLDTQNKQADIDRKETEIKSLQTNQTLDAKSKSLAIQKAALELKNMQMTPEQKATAMQDTIKSVSQPSMQFTPEFTINAKGELETKLKPKDTSGLGSLGDVGSKTPEELQAQLKEQNPAYATYLQKLANGQFQLSGRGTKQIAQIQKDLSNLYPDMDMSQINSRYKTRNDFTTGTAAKNIKSLNTAVGHLSEMDKLIPQLKNSGFKMWNQLAQTATREFGGNPTLQRFKAVKVALSGELSNIYKNSGGTDQEIKQVSDTIDSADSPETLQAEVQEAMSLMGSRMNALQDQWHNAYNRSEDDDFPVVSPRSKKTLSSLGYDDQNNTNEASDGTLKVGKYSATVIQ